MIPILGKRAVTRIRRGPPTWYEGRPVPAIAVQTVIVASVQPVSGDARQWLPDGADVRAAREAFAYADLRVGDETTGAPPDVVRVVEPGQPTRDYVVVSAQPWPAFLGHPGHTRAGLLAEQAYREANGAPPPPPPPPDDP